MATFQLVAINADEVTERIIEFIKKFQLLVFSLKRRIFTIYSFL